MSSEKAEVLVLRQVDFSESSRVVTFFSREFGKFAALAKGARRLKGPFDAALDLLSQCRVVFIKKSAGSLNLLTEARLIRRFRPEVPELSRTYGGYYVAELISLLTEDFDPAPAIYDLSVTTLQALTSASFNPSLTLVQFEITLLREIGLLPNLFECSVCGVAVPASVESGSQKFAHWVTQGGLLCRSCRREEYAGSSISAGSVQLLQQLSGGSQSELHADSVLPAQLSQCHRFAVSSLTQAIGRKPATLRYIQI